MSKPSYPGLLTLIFLTFCGAAKATPVGLSVGASTAGAHGSVSYDVNNDFNVRIGVNRFSTDIDLKVSGVDYETEVELDTLFGIVDWYPWGNRFRLSTGVVSNSNQAKGVAAASNGELVFNDVTFSLADAGNVTYGVEFQPLVGYFGLGWGNTSRGKGFSFFADMGLIYQGEPDVRLDVENRSAVGLQQADINAEIRKYEKEFDDYRFYPVFTLGIGLNLR